MNTLVAVAIAPFGVGDELSAHVAEVVRVIRASGLPNKTCSMFTEIEGEWDEVMRVVKEATMILAEKGIRTEVVLKADVRPGHEGMMSRKVEIVDELLGSAANVPSDAAAGESVSIPSDAAAGDQPEKTAEGRAGNLAEGGAR